MLFRHIGAIQPREGVRRHRVWSRSGCSSRCAPCAAGAVADQLAHRQRLVHHALARRRRHPRAAEMPMTDRQACLGIAAAILLAGTAPCPSPPDPRAFKMRWDWAAAEMCTIRPPDLEIGGGAECVHFTSPDPCTSSRAKETPLNSANTWNEGLLHHIHQHRSQPAAVSHADAGISFTPIRATDPITVLHGGDGGFCRLPARKRLVPTYFFAQKASKPSASVSCSRILRLARPRRRPSATAPPRCALLDPGFLLRILDVHGLPRRCGRSRRARQDRDDESLGAAYGQSAPALLSMKIGRSRPASVKPQER